MKRVIKSIKADLGYLIDNQREFGLSWRNAVEDFKYMIENFVNPLRER